MLKIWRSMGHFLLQSAADVDASDANGMTALTCAIQLCHGEIVESLQNTPSYSTRRIRRASSHIRHYAGNIAQEVIKQQRHIQLFQLLQTRFLVTSVVAALCVFVVSWTMAQE